MGLFSKLKDYNTELEEIKGTIKVTIGLGANWIKYISKTATKTVTVGKETTLTISTIDA